MYQRPNIASMSFLLIFLGGVYEMCYDAMPEHECWKGKLNGKRIFDISYSNKL